MDGIEICALAIIPAKTDSKRLKKKNLRVINGKTLLEHAIDYASNSSLVKYIIVTSESDEVLNVTKKYSNVMFFYRDKNYMGEREVADVYVNLLQSDLKKDNGDIIQNITHVAVSYTHLTLPTNREV